MRSRRARNGSRFSDTRCAMSSGSSPQCRARAGRCRFWKRFSANSASMSSRSASACPAGETTPPTRTITSANTPSRTGRTPSFCALWPINRQRDSEIIAVESGVLSHARGEGMSSVWETYLAERRDQSYNELLELLRIPSISTEPAHKADVAAAADWVAARLKKAGVPEVEIVPTAKHPVVIGRWHAAPGKQTVIVYGHYDVQPVDPLELWETPPFE